MAKVLTGISGNLISAASAGFAPTNSADVSAIASAYQVVSATATQLYAGTAYVTSVNGAPLSASRAGQAANASLANSAYYDGTGRLISSLPDSAAVSAIASAYAESAVSGKLDESAIGIDSDLMVVSSINDTYVSAWIAGSAEHWSGASSKQDTLTFSYDDDKISAINGSALAGQGGGGMITSIQSALDPWYATSISGLNGSSLYPKWAASASAAGVAVSANYANNAQSAGAAPTAWASSFITGVSSPSGTIRVLGGTAIESTNSAVMPSTVIEGFSTSYGAATLGPGQKLHCVLPTANPSTELLMPFSYNTGRVVWSSDNGIEDYWEKDTSPETITAQVPNATAVDIWVADAWIGVSTVTASAATQEIGGGVAELAWASALPTYSYDAEDKISAINGSAIAGGGGGVDSATVSAIASSYAESAVSSYQPLSGMSGYASAFSAGEGLEFVQSGSDQVLQVEAPVDIVAGPGIVIDNPDGNTLRVSTEADAETVLCTETSQTNTHTLSESPYNFKYLRFEFFASGYPSLSVNAVLVPMSSGINSINVLHGIASTANWGMDNELFTVTSSSITMTHSHRLLNNWTTNSITHQQDAVSNVKRIIGIHRIANN